MKEKMKKNWGKKCGKMVDFFCKVFFILSLELRAWSCELGATNHIRAWSCKLTSH